MGRLRSPHTLTEGALISPGRRAAVGAPMAKVDAAPPDNATIARDSGGCCSDPGALPNQPCTCPHVPAALCRYPLPSRLMGPDRVNSHPTALCSLADGYGVCTHKGTSHYPAHDGMLDAGAVSGTYQDPCCSPCSVHVKGVPAVGFLCMIQQCGGVPICCYIAPFNCCTPVNCSTGAPGLRKPGLKCGVGGCGYLS